MVRQREELPELRHLRYFMTLAEELHFARAAERLQMEQSPLSRAIRDMERLLGVRLFERNTRGTRITRAGKVLVEYAERTVTLLEQAKVSVRSAALGHSHQLRIGVSDCTAYSRLIEILVRYQAARPDVLVSLHEMPIAQQICALRDDLLDACISLDGGHRSGIEAEPIGRDPIYVAIPYQHPLATMEAVHPDDLARHPLILFGAESDLGGGSQVASFVNTLTTSVVAARATTLGTLLSLVALGHGIGLVGAAQISGVRRSDVELRRIGGGSVPSLTTYVLHADCGVSEPLDAFIELARELSSAESEAEPS